jgi:hypothetical protein
MPDGVIYAAVHTHRGDNRVMAAEARPVLGSPEGLGDVLGRSAVSHRVNTAFVGRQNATDRGRDVREARETYRFSKDWQAHEAMTDLTPYSDNFRWCVPTLRVRDENGRWRERSPAPAAGLTDHASTWREWFSRPAVQST